MLSQIGQVTAVTDSLKTIFSLKNLLILLDLPFTLIYKKKNKRKIKPNIDRKIPALLLLSLGLVFIMVRGKPILPSLVNQELFSYHTMDIIRALKDEDPSLAVDQYEMESIVKEMKGRARLKDGKHTGIAKDKNLVVIQVESLQNFVVNKKYEGQELTPNINRLIKDKGSLYFDNYYQSIASGNTSDAEFTSNNSLYPSIDEPSYTEYEKNTFYGLPWLLRDNGYKAWAFHGYKKDYWNRDKAYASQGFEKFIGLEDYQEKEKIGFGLSDGEFFSQSLDHIKHMSKAGEKPFYAFMISLSNHNPYKMPLRHQKIRLKEKDKDSLFGNYLQAVHYTDKVIGDFIEDLKKEGLYDNTVIALYGDHFGLSATDKDNKEKMTDYLGQDYDLDEMMKIPLVIHIPGENIKETISSVGSQMDFYPTIQNLMGYDNKDGLVFGRDLLNLTSPNYAVSQSYALRGSFISDKIFFDMSKDGIFENSRVYRLDTRQRVKPGLYRRQYDRLISEINTCEYLLKQDLIKEILQKASISNKKTGKNKKEKLPDKFIRVNPSLKELDQYKKQGIRGFELELKEDKLKGKLRTDKLDFEDIENWLEKNRDCYILTKINFDKNLIGERSRDNPLFDIYLDSKQKGTDITKNIIVEIEDISSYTDLAKFKYKSIYKLDQKNLDKTSLSDILRKYPDLQYISMSEDLVYRDIFDIIKGKDIFIRLEKEDKIKDLKQIGISGIILEK